jgi:hypothetical protein
MFESRGWQTRGSDVVGRGEGSAATDSEDGKTWTIETPSGGAEGKGGTLVGREGEGEVGREGSGSVWEESLEEGGSRKEKGGAECMGRLVPSDLGG